MPWYIGTKSQEGRVKKKWRRVSSSTFYLKGGRNFWKIIEPIVTRIMYDRVWNRENYFEIPTN